MGSTLNKSVTEQAVQASMDAVTQSISNCSTPVTATNSTNISATDGSTVYFGGNTSQSVDINSNCVSNSVTRTSTSFDITEKTKENLKTITQQFSLSKSKTKQVTKALTELSTSITSQFQQNCVNALTLNNTTNVSATGGSTIYAVVDSSQTATAVTSCILSTDTVTAASTKLSTLLATYTSAKVQSFLFYLAIIVVGLVVLVGIVLIGLVLAGVIGKKKPTSTRKSTSSSTSSTIAKLGTTLVKKLV